MTPKPEGKEIISKRTLISKVSKMQNRSLKERKGRNVIF